MGEIIGQVPAVPPFTTEHQTVTNKPDQIVQLPKLT
jgi:hypothetical protein